MLFFLRDGKFCFYLCGGDAECKVDYLVFLVNLCLDGLACQSNLKVVQWVINIFCNSVIFEQVAEELFTQHALCPLCYHSSRAVSHMNAVPKLDC